MNMKKTIAAIAAGAVAVSAMATTVSALEATTLTYNLVKSVKNDDAAGTITATFTNVPLEAGGTVVIEAVGTSGASGDVNADNSWGNFMMTISGSFWDDEAGTNKSFVPVVATRRSWETGYSIEGARCTQNNIVTLPVVNASAAATNVALKASTSAVITVTLKYYDLPSSVDYAGALNNLIRDGARGIKLATTAAGVTAGANSEVVYTSNGKVNKFGYVNEATQTAINAAAGEGFAAQYDGTKWVQQGIAPTVTVAGFTGTGANAGLSAGVVDISALLDTTTLKAAKVPTGLDNKTVCDVTTLTYKDGTDGWIDNLGNKWAAADIALADSDGNAITAIAGDKVTLSITGGVAEGTTAIAGAATVAAALNINPVSGDKLDVTGYAGGAAGSTIWTSPISGAATETAGNSESKYPYHSTLKNSIYGNATVGIGGSIASAISDGSSGSGDVLTWIGYANADSGLSEYTADCYKISDAARSVINDCIQNYGDVVFTFNTATSKVKDGKYSTDNDAVDYTAFGRHFWDKSTGYDVNTIYIANDWVGNNLFEGALIINNNLTLSLGATDKFDWTSTSLSFSWDAIQDTALTQNQYANYIQNMVLRTSTDWYWDNLTVSLGETEAEDMGEGAPVEGDTEDLPEEEETDVDFGEEEEEEEEPEATEPEPEPAPVETATNPGTGNAPVALAVIPVALAAAAVVAKKRG